jgi:putative acyl-CoA dehydrogenase
VEQLALALQGALLVRQGNPQVAEAFCASRLSEGNSGRLYGTLPPGIDWAALIRRGSPGGA